MAILKTLGMAKGVLTRIRNPWRLIADRLGFVHDRYTLRTRDGAAFEIDGGTCDRFVLYEIAVRGDYLRSGAIRPGANVVDIGANIGIFTVLAARRVGPAGRVIAIEPNRETADRLERNVALNSLGNVVVYRAAVTGTAGQFTLHTGEESIFSALVPVDGRWSLTGTTQTIDGIPLADILQQEGIDCVDFLKIDCEGGEYDIFDTAAPSLWTRLPSLCMEMHELQERKPPELVAKLKAEGYVVDNVGLLYATRAA